MPGYEWLLEARADPAHPDHDQVADWLDPAFDPARFDPDEITLRLRPARVPAPTLSAASAPPQRGRTANETAGTAPLW